MKPVPAISIIVAVYNVEPYLSRCLDSIRSQTFENFEVLLINDGSSDLSGSICDEYASKDKRFIVIHKENGGVSTARNVGIEKARGEYSIHIDPDDYIDSNMLYDMYTESIDKSLDVLVSNYYAVKKDNVQLIDLELNNITRSSLLYYIMYGNMGGALWNKMIRHSLYKKSEAFFEISVRCCEDLLVLLDLYRNFINIGYIEKAYYYYCYRPESIVRSRSLSIMVNDSIQFTRVLSSKNVENGHFNRYLNYSKIRTKILLLSAGQVTRSEINKFYPEIDYLVSQLEPSWIKRGLFWLGVKISPKCSSYIFKAIRYCIANLK